MSWSKTSALAKLEAALTAGRVDAAVRPILDLINTDERFYTTSSCAGRIQALALPTLGDKRGAVIMGKWHRQITVPELRGAIEKGDGEKAVWVLLLAEPPIFHIVPRDLPAAARLLQLARDAGFKNSGVRSLRYRNEKLTKIVVELVATDRLDLMLAGEGLGLPAPARLAAMVDAANHTWSRGAAKLDRLAARLATGLGGDQHAKPGS